MLNAPTVNDTCVELAKVLKNEFNLLHKQEYKKIIKKLITSSYDEIKKSSDEWHTHMSAGAEGSLFGLFSMGVATSYSNDGFREQFNSLKERYQAQDDLELTDDDLLFISTVTMDESAYNVLADCIKRKKASAYENKLNGLIATWSDPDTESPSLVIYYDKEPHSKIDAATIKQVKLNNTAVSWNGDKPKFPIEVKDGGSDILGFARSGTLEKGYPKGSVTVVTEALGSLSMELEEISPVYGKEALLRYKWPTGRWQTIDKVDQTLTTPNDDHNDNEGQPRSSDGKWKASDTTYTIEAAKGNRLANVRLIHLRGPASHHERQRLHDGKWRWLVPSLHPTRDIRISDDDRVASIVIRSYTSPITFRLEGDEKEKIMKVITKKIKFIGNTLSFQLNKEAIETAQVIVSLQGTPTTFKPGETIKDLTLKSERAVGPDVEYIYTRN